MMLALLGQLACASIPPPDVLGEIDQVRAAKASSEARALAPTTYALAEKLRADAQAAFEEGDTAGARLLGERALATYAEAVALARVVRADQSEISTTADGTAAEKRLAELDVEHQKVAADIAALEARLRVLRDAEPISPSDRAKPQRERARAEAVSALRLQAQLLCAAAQLLTKSSGESAPKDVVAASKALADLDALLADKPAAAPIDHAVRARAGCLRSLTLVRRTRDDKSKATGAGDALLAALSKMPAGGTAAQGTPRRDDRGVVVTFRGMFAGDELSAAGSEALDALAAAATAYPGVPVMVVLHQKRPLGEADRKVWQQRASALVAALKQRLKAPIGDAQLAGTAAPVVSPKGKYADRNERVDIVFVTPRSL